MADKLGNATGNVPVGQMLGNAIYGELGQGMRSTHDQCLDAFSPG